MAMKEVEPARHVFTGGAGHGIEDDGRLLALEDVDGADTNASGTAWRMRATARL
jgi:hypothetical protein